MPSRRTPMLAADEALDAIRRTVTQGMTDAMWLRRIYGAHDSLHEVVRQQCRVWRGAQTPE